MEDKEGDEGPHGEHGRPEGDIVRLAESCGADGFHGIDEWIDEHDIADDRILFEAVVPGKKVGSKHEEGINDTEPEGGDFVNALNDAD